ncbi:methyltransferase domain-containing protein [Streptomyces sp. MRC013]|uniref:class I SAM-dependent methyltransferase n=1 Tax=Streptomyces sp. MRC013 TaxID=2898276 RepID=UPI002027548E|nr:methyltransferase domain-containing protein [Streptomyces sp. MRC013]URM89796.1 methyltransferase domain-containing protein [Streptomyces sp. MRC013]
MIGTLLKKPLEVVETNFRKPDGTAGRLVGHLMTLQHRSLTVWTIEHMEVRRSQRVLDVGCGGGMAVKLLSERTPQGFVAGVDYSMDMVSQAVRRNADAIARGRVEVRHGDSAALPYDDAGFDHVSAIETFYFWPDPMRGLAEAHRVLRPGGQVAITLEMSREAAADDPSLVQRFFGRQFTERSERDGLHILSGAELTGMLAEAGFRNVRFVAEPRRSLGWVCALGQK